ncbi:beta-mannosidase [Mucilaginibacter sp. PAMB04274]|uniref:glycoside hydrolase 5 family protein n=1 Tax=Mucilaginibacter sp. PAMB04274 TaxID=3138568 RepID=UPI0031F6C636
MLKSVKIILLLVAIACINCHVVAQNSFVKVKGHQFYRGAAPYTYIGGNYWYGGLLSAVKGEAGKQRLIQELDFLKQNGVTNLRVLAGSEGEPGSYYYSVAETAQPKQQSYNEEVLKGLDYLLQQMGKRHMTAILYLTNNWQWSGGLDQYLQWNGYGQGPLPQTENYSWDKNKAYTTQFYNCLPCQNDLNAYIKHLVTRTNTYTNKKYIDDTAIMAWELANEPRPMTAANNDKYLDWIARTSSLIKGLDRNHLVTIGSEGDIASDMDRTVYENANRLPGIDYLTIHIWPKNWNWFKDTSISVGFNDVLKNTKNYIDRHVTIAEKLNKPLVIEEFGLPRDLHSFDPTSSTLWRDKYYHFVFSIWQSSVQKQGVINGANFWAVGGTARAKPEQKYWWKPGDDYTGDPPQEEQGLNAVFNTDDSTWKVIRSYTKK